VPKTVTLEPVEIVNEYFARVRARDLRLAELFHMDAELVGLGTRRQGRSAIAEFYRGIMERAQPTPRQVGSLLCDGSRVAAEIIIDLAGGGTVHAIDLFDTEDGLIRSLTYFIAAE